MHIRDVMTPNPRTVRPGDTIQSAAQIMRDEDTGAVPVVENGRAVGMVTDRDIVVRAVAEGGDMDAAVSTIMSSDVQSCREEDSVAEAVGKMASEKIRRLVVLNEGGALVGIVSLGDISKDYGAKQVGKTLEDISFAPPDQ